MDREILRFRASCVREIRRFFEEAGYLEVDTPVVSGKVIPEPTIDLLNTTIHGAGDGPGTPVFLLPSPEFYMKRLVAAGSGSIFQFSRCFRDREPLSRLHSPEFLMLEWYTVNADYIGSIDTTEALLERLCTRLDLTASAAAAVSPPVLRMTIEEAFSKYAGIDLCACGETRALRTEAERLGLTPALDADWPELFHLILLSEVEQQLPVGRPVALLDYPAQVSCLAKQKAGTPWRERWELYLSGVEIANCFTEMVSPAEVAAYFKREGTELRKAGRPEQTDESFPDIYDTRHPACSGVALGLDRLLMVLSGSDSIAQVMPFTLRYGDAQEKTI